MLRGDYALERLRLFPALCASRVVRLAGEIAAPEPLRRRCACRRLRTPFGPLAGSPGRALSAGPSYLRVQRLVGGSDAGGNRQVALTRSTAEATPTGKRSAQRYRLCRASVYSDDGCPRDAVATAAVTTFTATATVRPHSGRLAARSNADDASWGRRRRRRAQALPVDVSRLDPRTTEFDVTRFQ
jgi:hypothetical protein